MNFSKLDEYLISLEARGIPACECIVCKNHKTLYHHISGHSDSAGLIPASEDDMYFIYSATKLLTVCALMQLCEKGLVSLDDRLCSFLPEYRYMTVRRLGKIRMAGTPVTIKHLLTMTGGFSYSLNLPALIRAREDKHALTRDIIRALAEEPLNFEPGERFLYSLSHDILASVVEEVSGQSFGEYLKNNIFIPLGIKDMSIHLKSAAGEDLTRRLSAQYTYDTVKESVREIPKSNPFCLSENYESGGAGIIAAAREYILFADALACGGEGASGLRILKPETIDLIRTPALSPSCQNDFTRAFNRRGYGYGLGVRTMTCPAVGNSLSPVGEFGWDGAAGAYVLCDVKNSLSVFYVQHVMGCTPAYTEFHPAIRNLVYECAGVL